MQTKQCVYCGTDFQAHHHFDKYCSNVHYANCTNCGKKFEIKDIRRPAKNCSATCATTSGHTKESAQKRVENSRLKWGVDYPFQAEEIKEKINNHPSVMETRYGSETRKQLMLNRYGVENPFLLPNAVPGRISKINQEWKRILDEATGLDWELEKQIDGVRTVDLFIEHNGKKLVVELHPTATHNSFKNLVACNRRGCTEFPCEHAKSRLYHQERALKLNEQGCQMVSVFDWFPQDRVVAFIRSALQLNEHRIGAKKCFVKRIPQSEANKFLKQFHLLGGSRKQEYCYGLFYDGLLVQVQTFVNRGNDWEARRLATRDNWQVMGGVSKGTKAFIQEVSPAKIIAFSDLSLSVPDFDSRFNHFQEKELQPPVLCWSKNNRMILDKSAAFQSADRLIGIAKDAESSPYPENLSNREVFLAEGWLPVWDCGKLKETLTL